MGDFMNDSINNFIALLTKGDFFLIFLIVMMVIIVGVIVYLVKLQIGDSKYYDDEDEEDEDEDLETENVVSSKKLKEEKQKRVYASEDLDVQNRNVSNESVKVTPVENKVSIEEKESPLFEEEPNIYEDLMQENEDKYQEEVEPTVEYSGNLVFENPRKASMNIAQSRFDFESVGPVTEESAESLDVESDIIASEFKSFEDEQEASAIISASELESRLNELRASGEIVNHEREIQKYEEEQETKAIISYDELLSRANAGVINYESEEDMDGIRVSKVDTNSIETFSEVNDKPYYKEESFLQAMKEFRRAL